MYCATTKSTIRSNPTVGMWLSVDTRERGLSYLSCNFQSRLYGEWIYISYYSIDKNISLSVLLNIKLYIYIYTKYCVYKMNA